jgi:hypothetical protein
MARGDSGRIVLEVNPIPKREANSVLDRKGQTLREWLLETANAELLEAARLRLDFADAAQTSEDRARNNIVA